MSFSITVHDQQALVPVFTDRLEAIARDVLMREGARGGEIGIVLVDGAAMRALNYEFLGHDYDTDVLSFPAEPSEPHLADDATAQDGLWIEGEIVISTKFATEAARHYNWDVRYEIALDLVHGLLHLLGYDDTTPSASRLMQDRECWHMSRWGPIPPGRGDAAARASFEA